MRPIFLVISTVVILLFSSAPCRAQRTLSEDQEQYLRGLTANLHSGDSYKRESAMDALGNSRLFVVERTIEILDLVLAEKKDMKDYDSSFNMVCRVAGEWRIERATGPLLPYLSFALDPNTFRAGAIYGAKHYYPAAAALVEIRSPDLNRQLLDLFTAPINDSKLQVATWMLQKANGAEVAQFLVERQLSNEERRLKNLNRTTSQIKENLLKVKELLQTEGGVSLPDPLVAQKSLTTETK